MKSTHHAGSIALRLLTLCWLAALAACGSGGDGAVDLDSGESVVQEPPVSTTVGFSGVGGAPFIRGTSPFTAQFSGGDAASGTWIIPDGGVGTVDFTTPADSVSFEAIANFVAGAAAAAAQKPSVVQQPSQVVNAPFDVAMYVRGSVFNDWAFGPGNQLTEVADNVLEVTLPLEATEYQFKVADGGWTGPTNCGADTDPTPVTVGTPFTLQCDALSQNLLLTIATAGNYKFTFNVSDVDAPTILVAQDTGGGGNGGGGEPEPAGMKITFFDSEGTVIGEPIEATATTAVDQIRRGAESRIARVVIENLGDIGDIGIDEFSWTADPRFTPAATATSISYRRADGDYSNTTITVDGETYPCDPTGSAFGCVVTGVPVLPYSELAFVVNSNGTTETIRAYPGAGGDGVYAFSGSSVARTGEPAGLPASSDEVILYYLRPGAQTDATYSGWGLHLFPVEPAGDAWTVFTGGEFPYEGIDPEWGAYFRIALPGNESPTYSNNPDPIDTFPDVLGFIIHKGDEKDPGPDQFIRIAEDGNVVFVVSGVNEVSPLPPGGGTIARVAGAAAHWVDQRTIIVANDLAEADSLELLYSPDASIQAGLDGVTGNFEAFPLASTTNPELPNMRHLHDDPAFSLPANAENRGAELLRGQLIVLARDADGVAIGGTLVQTPGALDALYAGAAYGEPLGVSYAGGTPSVSVWAPTALLDPGVTLNVYNADGTLFESVPMIFDEATGIWSVTGPGDWDRRFYTFTLRVYSYATNSIVTNEVTDPYSVGLAADSVRSQFVNLDDADTKPAGWDTLVKPAIDAPEDISVYELHIRDFSVADSTVSEGARGKYTAFSAAQGLTDGRQHLANLADAGLTHVHLLPTFDIATVRERRADRVELEDPVEDLCDANPAAESLCATDAGKTVREAIEDAIAANDLDKPGQIVEWIRDFDGFNWGYDPLHYGAPEGSYATDPDGITRIREFREMVVGLADLGLGTIMDVVYNHTNASGQNSRSVLDRIVPGYYHRRGEANGNVLRDSCCDDTAAEFRMMEKLMIDTAEIWARDYKIDGFRFDLMSFHPIDSMLLLKERMEAVNPDFYIYGEAWNFGDVQNDRRFLQARQANMGGSGIGSFSDRIRDPIRGGGPFDSNFAHVQNQGFVSGWYYDPNSSNDGSAEDRQALIADTDNIRLWLAGGLANYRFTNSVGDVVPGVDIDYRGQDSGYTQDPQEAINYIDKHDNETLWDISQYKHPVNTPTADRVRAHNVGYSLVVLGQGIPFIHAGGDILRSKSMDRNSFDSGDWYNELLWDLSDTKWNKGLPRPGENSGSYPAIQETIFVVNADPMAPSDLQRANEHMREMLEIRYSSLLFRLRTGRQIEQRVSFLNTGPFQVPGVIAMEIDGCSEPDLAASEAAILTIFNASDDPRTLGYYKDQTWNLHPVLAASSDPVVQTAKHDANGFFVPARTTAVFIRTAPTQISCAPYPRDIFVRGVDTDWSANPARELEFLGGTSYSVTFPIANVGAQEFKIADADWTSGTDCGGGAEGSAVTLGVPLPLDCAGGPNLSLSVPQAGNYTFALEAADPANPILTVSKTPPFDRALFVRGVNGDWGTTNAMTFDGIDGYTALVPNVTAGAQEFKVADADWTSGTDCGGGSGGSNVTLGVPLPLNCSGGPNISLNVTEAGSYFFNMDVANSSAPTLTVEKVPFAAALFVRGLNGDWSDAVGNQMSFVGGGTYHYRKTLGAGSQEFKVADSGWTSGTDCGAAGPLVVGNPLVLNCAGGPNIPFTVVDPGSYMFNLDATNTTAPELTVTGP